MSARMTEKNFPAPLSYFIIVKIGKMQFGSMKLKSGITDPEVITSMTIEKSATTATTWKNKNTDKSKTIKNNSLSTVSDDVSKADLGLVFTTITINMSMANDLSLEKKLITYIKKNLKKVKSADNGGLVTIRYGYVNGSKSFLYRGYIAGMELSSDLYTLTLTIKPTNGITDKYTNWKTKKKFDKKLKRELKKKKTQYSTIVKLIAKNQKWKIGTITPTKKIRSTSVKRPTSKQNPIQYIDSFKKKATSKKGGKYKSRFRYNKNGTIVYEFVPQTFKSSANYRAKKNYNFVMNMIPDGVVVNFKPQLTGGLGVAAAFNVSKNDKNKKKKKKNFKNVYGVITKGSKDIANVSYEASNSKKNSKGLVNADDNILALNADAVRINASEVDVANYAEAVIKNNFGSYCYSNAMNAGATMEILGDPQLQHGDLINVLPMYPAQEKSNGAIMHPSGGTYRITGITDTIGNGYITSLTLVKENNTKNLKKVKSKKSKNSKSKKKRDKPKKYKVGDKINFNGGKYYISSYKGSKGHTAKAGPAKIKKINNQLLNTKGAHPYCIVHTDDTSKVYGWVNTNSISRGDN